MGLEEEVGALASPFTPPHHILLTCSSNIVDAGQPTHLTKRETEAQGGKDLIKVIQQASGRSGS